MKRLCCLLAPIVVFLMAVSGSTLAAPPVWTFVEAGYNNIDIDDLNEEGDGYFIGASFGGRSLHVFGRWIDNSTDNNIDLTRWYAGGGWHGLLGESADLFGDVAYVSAEADTLDENGYFARAGARWRPIGLLEVGANARWEDLGDISDEVVWEANAMVYVWRLGIGLNYETQDSIDTYNVFVRFNFGAN